MINLIFKTIEEKRPKHGQEILVLYCRSQFGFEGINPKYTKVEYSWEEYENGEFTGTSYCYNNEEEVEGCELVLMDDDGMTLNSEMYWIDVDEFYDLVFDSKNE